VAIEVSTFGRAKTVIQAVAVALLLLSVCVPDPAIATSAAISLIVAVMLTVASGADLLVRAPVLLVSGRERVAANAR
jgi:phosphatidylglycerophosphate synthase